MISLRQGLLWASMFCAAACGGDAGKKDPGGSTVKTLLTEALADAPDREVRVLEVDYPPGGATPAHHHPGQIIAHVLQGAVMSGLDGAVPTRFTQGQTWSEKQGQVHSVSRNASATEPAKLLVFFITAPGKPVLEPEK
jgi:quercetin dioxygenase-like cupin family protein